MSDAHSPPIFTRDGPRATIRLARPREHNRMDPTDLPVLMAHFDRIEADPSIRVLIVTGTGEKTFSSGYTLGALTGIAADAVTFDAMVDRLEDLPLPTIAALNGSVYGGATDLALACDFRIGVTGSRLSMPASRIGLHYYPSGMRRYVERLGLGAAKRLFLLGEHIPCEQLERWGYLDQLVAPAELARTVDRWVDQLVAGQPTVMRAMKRHANNIARGTFDRAAIERDYTASLESADLQEGLTAHAEKRAPRFTGR